MLIGAKEGLILTTKCRALSVMVLYFFRFAEPNANLAGFTILKISNYYCIIFESFVSKVKTTVVNTINIFWYLPQGSSFVCEFVYAVSTN